VAMSRVVNWGALSAAIALAVGSYSCFNSYLDVTDVTVRAGTFTLIHVAGAEDVGATADNPLGRLAHLAAPDLRGGRDRLHGVLTTVSGGFLTPPGPDGAHTISLLNEIGVEVAAPSDREFSLTGAEFHRRVQQARFTVISSNLTDAAGHQFTDMTRGIVMPVKTDKGLIDVGYVGLMRSTAPPPWVTYMDPIEAAKTAVPGTRKWAQFVVALTNFSIADDEALIAAVPGIDLVLGSNRGETWAITREPDTTPIAKADVNARTAVVATITITEGSARPAIMVRIAPLDKSPVN
jgi:2',3'-cyclic-nucleotide 2'-phosphodiesterase (5'-nucleotidase family)